MKKFLIIVLFLALFLFSGCQRTKPVQQTRPAESAKPVEEVDSLKSTPQTEEKAVLPPRQVVEKPFAHQVIAAVVSIAMISAVPS